MTVAIGFFDGVHLGHQAILAGADVALTFENHPLSFLAPERAPRLIMDWEARAKAIRALGVHVTALDFDADIANLSPKQFLDRLKNYATVWTECWQLPAEPLRIRAGANWRFGKGGVGTAALARECGFEVTLAPYATYRNEVISSTRIRSALEIGAMEEAKDMLGRPFVISGEVFAGKRLGREFGFPTVNIRPCAEAGFRRVRLPHGVYAVEVAGRRAVANFGVAPTVGDRAWREPVWELNFEADPGELLQSVEWSVAVRRYLRPERTFESLAALKEQIARDRLQAFGK